MFQRQKKRKTPNDTCARTALDAGLKIMHNLLVRCGSLAKHRREPRECFGGACVSTNSFQVRASVCPRQGPRPTKVLRGFAFLAPDRTPRVSSEPAWAARESTPASVAQERAVRPVSEGSGKSLRSSVVTALANRIAASWERWAQAGRGSESLHPWTSFA